MKRLVLNFLASAAVVWGAGFGVAPTLDCVTYDAAHSEVTAFFGYVNTNAVATTVPFGAQNFFDPSPAFRGQSIILSSGVFHYSFSVSWFSSAGSFVTWHLNGFTATASNDPALYCPSASSSCWDTNNNGVCDLASEDINGDGACNPLDCQGRTGAKGETGSSGQQGPTGAAGPAGLPGISPAITTITTPSTTATATASCSGGLVMLNGGGTCAVPNTNSISGRIASSTPSGANAWTVSCSTGNATAVALCAPPAAGQ